MEFVEELPATRTTVKTITPAGIEAAVELGDVVDVAAERDRLEKKIGETAAEIARAERKLADEAFVQRAPAEVVARQRSKLQEWRAAQDRLVAQLEALGGGAA